MSVELRIAGKKVFSFQVASRSAQLDAPERLPWADVSLDSLNDLIASKMTALVERGAPRDFRDVYTLCERGLTSARESWGLWAERSTRPGAMPTGTEPGWLCKRIWPASLNTVPWIQSRMRPNSKRPPACGPGSKRTS